MGISLKDLNERIRSRIPGAAGARPAVRGLPAATALEIDGLTLRIADASRSGTSSRVDQVRSCPLELPENADRADASVLGSAIAKALAKARIKPGPVVLGIGRSQVILRTVVVPDTGLTGTIAALVRFQVARDLPFRLDEAIIDFQILRKLPARPALDGEVTAAPTTTATATNDSVDRVEALVAITRQESLDFLRRVAEAAGVSLAAVGWLSQANATCLQLANGGAGSPSAPRALVALKSEEVGIEILEGRSLLFSRGMPMPSSLDTEPETWIRAATIEVVRTLHAFGGTAGRTAPEAALILGGTGREAALSTALETRLGFPVPQVTLARSPGLDSSEAAAVASGFTSIGLALGATDPAGLEFDFLNPKRPTPPPDFRKIRMIAGFTVGLVILMAVLGVRKTLISRREATLTALQAELTTGEKTRPVYRQMIQQAATLKAWSAEERDWLDHYAHLSAVLPPSEEIYLTSVAFGPNRAIKLGVQARNGEILGKVDRLLRAAGYDVELTVPAKLKFDLTKLTPPARPADDASLETLRKGGAR